MRYVIRTLDRSIPKLPTYPLGGGRIRFDPVPGADGRRGARGSDS